MAQRPIFKNYTVNDGLVANSVRRIFQDSKGFLWIATFEGLSKYDGHQFNNYSTANGLSHNLVNDFYEAKDGRLYAALNNGSIDEIAENKVIQNAAGTVKAVNQFLNSPTGQVIVTTDNAGVQEFKDGKLFKPQQPFSGTSYNDIAWLNDSLFISVTDSSVQVLTWKYELYAEMKRPDFFKACPVYMDSQKRIWLGTNSGLKQLLFTTQKNTPPIFTPIPASFNIPALQRSKVNVILEDNSGVIWIGTVEGLVKINRDGTHQVITSKDGLVADNVTCIFQDKEKNIWFGTALGLSKLVSRFNIRIYNASDGLSANSPIYVYPVKQKNPADKHS